MMLVIVDSHSKWPEICLMNGTTTGKTITVLRELFARYGIPRQLVSDNDPQFTAEEFSQFMSANGVRHIRSSPYHPASNGAAERLVQTVKKALSSGHQDGIPIEKTLATFYSNIGILRMLPRVCLQVIFFWGVPYEPA